jgi:cytoskeletal protein CcmA (bactofilin family)
MISARTLQLLVVIAAVVQAGGSPPSQGPQPPQAAAGGSPSSQAQQPPQGEAGGSPSSQDPQQDPQQEEEFRLTIREQLGEGAQSVRVGGTRLIFNDIFDFSDVANDLFVWAWLPTISGNVADNAFIGGQKVDLVAEGVIGGDLFLFAQTARIDGRVGGDLYSFVGDLTIGDTGAVEGAIYGSSGGLTINGTVGGPISYAGGAVVLNGTVHGDVSIEVGELEVGPRAVIEGDLRYESAREASIDPGARISGQLRYFAPREDAEEEERAPSGSWFSVWSVMWGCWWFLASFFVGAVALALGGDAARRPAACLASQPALGLGFGFVVAVVLPAASIVAIILLVTLPLGLLTLLIYVIAVYLARLVASQTIGDRLLRWVRGGREPSAYAPLALGLLLFYFLTKIPYVGFLIWLAAVIAGLGGIFLAVRARKGAESSAVPAPAPQV